MTQETLGGWAAVDARECSIDWAAGLVADRWALLVLREVALGVDRFDAVQAHLGVSRRTLADRLGALERHGVLAREPHREPGQRPRHRYRLTAAGRDLLPIVQALGEWGARHRPDDVGPPVSVVSCTCGAPVRVRATCTAGHEVPPAGADA